LLFRHQAICEFKAADFFEKPVNVNLFRDRLYELLGLVEEDTVVEKVLSEKSKHKPKKFVSEGADQLLHSLIENSWVKQKDKHSAESLKKNSPQDQKRLSAELKSNAEIFKQNVQKTQEKKLVLKKTSETVTVELEKLNINDREDRIEKKKYSKIDEEINRKFQEIVADLSKSKPSGSNKKRSKK